MHIAGERDDNVKFANQKDTIERVRKLNGCEANGQAWAEAGDLIGTQYASKGNTPCVSVIHPGGHPFPEAAPEFTVEFCKQHSNAPRTSPR